jgi:hypothetical protein
MELNGTVCTEVCRYAVFSWLYWSRFLRPLMLLSNHYSGLQLPEFKLLRNHCRVVVLQISRGRRQQWKYPRVRMEQQQKLTVELYGAGACLCSLFAREFKIQLTHGTQPGICFNASRPSSIWSFAHLQVLTGIKGFVLDAKTKEPIVGAKISGRVASF